MLLDSMTHEKWKLENYILIFLFQQLCLEILCFMCNISNSTTYNNQIFANICYLITLLLITYCGS